MIERLGIVKRLLRKRPPAPTDAPESGQNTFQGKVVDPLGRAWIDGRIPADEYFTQVWTRARKQAEINVRRKSNR